MIRGTAEVMKGFRMETSIKVNSKGVKLTEKVFLLGLMEKSMTESG